MKDAKRTCYIETDHDGCVWASVAGSSECAALGEPQAAFPRIIDAGPGLVRCMGAPRNSRVLSLLYQAVRRKDINDLQVCAPSLGQGGNAQKSLLRMQEINKLAGSLGGWHDFGMADLVAHVLHLANDADRVLWLTRHPAWPMWSFVYPMDPNALACVISLITDPRYHVDQRFPDRLTKLGKHIGMCGGASPAASSNPLRLAWSVQPTEPIERNPRAFFQHYASKSSATSADSLFLEFISSTWRMAVSRQQGEGIFDPSLFFDRGTAAAYERYLSEQRVDAAGGAG